MLHSAQEVYNYSGIYISYSLSSSSNALKVEPYLITPADSNDHVKVVHMSAYNTTHFGTAVFNNHQNAYIFFNEREAPQLALFTIYLQLPMYDFPHLLKGLYLCLDYNRNPIARRILFIKHSDSTSMDDFLELKGQLIPQDQLTDEQRPYYNYTCQPGDFIKTCSVPSPLLNEKDLEREKRMQPSCISFPLPLLQKIENRRKQYELQMLLHTRTYSDTRKKKQSAERLLENHPLRPIALRRAHPECY